MRKGKERSDGANFATISHAINTTFITPFVTRFARRSLINVAMELRKCCNHPFLNDGGEEKLRKDWLDGGKEYPRRNSKAEQVFLSER